MKNRTKWILLSIVLLLIVFFGLYRYYLYVHEDIWRGENEAIQRARQETGLVEGERVWKFVWDEVCWVVQGKTADGTQVMVWLPEGKQAQEKPLSEGVSEPQMRKIIEETLPDIDVVKLTPGIYNNQYVWELFYKDKTHHYYRFFSYSNGESLTEVFTLPNR
ncbi:cell wall elongation regulator TseB-like domain-containing protein [Paenibacillus aceti]|uniref:Cell wall elongation regulator TseB-like domain-containing protein n=1 Tax=Paenibacillus aceti TaxID=1820010 RepID=A0ABQ1VYP8_9BACL|nr:DUF5590 domain-containing protein [Paenibacillus aceti]GGG05025.1 hypothetical protein GCM10010913_28560 [Paenibacillus aceti]